MDMLGNVPGGPGGVSITGKWINKRTGKTIIARDNIISEDGMQIICSDGQMIPMREFSRDYIQASEEEYTPTYNNDGDIIGTTKGTKKEFDTTDILSQPIMPRTSTKTSSVKRVEREQPEETYQVTSNYTLIDKLFKKIDSKPKIKLTVEWADFPKQELKTLIDYLDVDKKEIAEYVYKNFADVDTVKLEIAQYLSSMLGE